MATIDKPLIPVEEGSQNRGYNQSPDERPGHSVRYWLIFAVLVLLAAAAVVFFGWLPRHKQQDEINKEAQDRKGELPRVQVTKVRRAPTTSELMIPGTTLAYTEAHIYARSSGYVTKRLVDIGDRVRQGQLMAIIDAPDLDRQVAQARSALQQSQANLIQLQAQLHLAELTWNRWKVLVERGVFSRQEGDQQEANYRVAEANVRAAQNTIEGNQENLNRLLVLQGYERVTAPFSGVITARNVDVGTLINAGGSGLGSSPSAGNPGPTTAAQGNNQGASGNLSSNVNPSTGGASGGEMFAMANTDRLRVLVSVPEAYTSIIHVGGRASLFFQERPNDKIEGRVTRTSASIDQNTRTLLVEVQVVNSGRRLVPGMYVVVNFIDVKGEPPLIIPGAAIIVRNAKTMVAVVDGQTVHLRPIVIGRDYGDQSEIAQGLKDGDAIVTDVTDDIQEGAEVDPQFNKSTGQAQSQQGGQSDKSPSSQGQYGNQGLANSAQNAGGSSGKGKGKSGSPDSGSGSASSGK